MSRWLVEYDTGNRYGPCSEENWKKFQEAQGRGLPFFLYPAFGYEFRMVATEDTNEPAVRILQKEKASG